MSVCVMPRQLEINAINQQVHRCFTLTINSLWSLYLDTHDSTAIIGQNIALVPFFSTRHLRLNPKWLTVMEITDVLKRKNVATAIFCQ